MLPGSSKLTYLQMYLKGAALDVISAYEPTDANHSKAWDHLKKRYGLKREIIFTLIKNFEDFKPKTSEPGRIRGVADALNHCLLHGRSAEP